MKTAKRTHMSRLLRLTALMVIAVVVLLLGAVYFLLGSDRGLQLIRDGVQRYGGKTLQIDKVQGRLLGNFELYDLRYTGANGTQLQLDRLRVDWTPAALWHGLLHLDKVTVDKLQLDLPAASKKKSSKPFELPQSLPLNLRIDALQLNGLALRQAGAAPFTLANASFKGSWIGDALRIDQLSTALPKTGPLTLQAQAVTGARQLHIKALRLSGPGNAELTGTLGYTDAPSDLTLRWENLQWPLTGKAVPTVSALQGQARLTGTLSNYRYALTAQTQYAGKPLQLQLDGRGDEKQTKIDTLKLDAGKGGSAQAQGTVTWSPKRMANLDLTLHRLDPALFMPGWNGLINGTMQTRTTFVDDEPDMAFTLVIDHSKLHGYPLSLRAEGSSSARQATLKSLTLDAAKGHVQAHGRVGWSPSLTADLDLKLQHLNPAVFAAQFPGDINGQLRVKTQQAGSKVPVMTYDAALTHSTLRGKPLSLQTQGHVELEAHQPVVHLKRLALALGSTHLDVSGQATPPFDLQGKLNSPDLGVFAPQLGGRLSFDFRLLGTRARPHLVSKGEGHDVHDGTLRVASIDWNADLDPLKPSKLNLQVKGASIAGSGSGGFVVSQATLQASGIEKYQHIKLHAATTRGRLDLQLAGGYTRKREEWGGQIVSLRLAPADLPVWTLQNSPGLLLGRQRLSLESTCLAGGSGRICADLKQAVKQPGLQLSWNLDAVRLASFKPLLPKDLDLAGQIDGSGKLHWENGNVDAVQSKMTLKGGVLTLAGEPTLQFQPSTLTVEQRQQALHAVVDLKAVRAQVQADVTAASATRFGERRLSGSVKLSIPDLAFLQPFVAELQSVRGHLDGALTLGGSIAKPQLTGHIDLADGSAKLRTPGITLQNVTFSLSGAGSGPLSIKGSMQSGGGSLDVSGQFDPTKIPLQVKLDVKGTNFQVVDTPDARAWVTPDLMLLRDAEGIHVDGSLTVPKADITPRGGLGGDEGVTVSPDQQIVGQKPQPAGAPLKIYSKLDLILGDAVRFKGYGLTTRIIGKVAVDETPKHPPLAQGELQLVDGKYKAYGQDLTIKTGRLIFTGGPVTKPGIDILAIRKPREDIQVGVQVRGTLDKPQLTLTSQPAMPREQQLSWLLFGQPLEQNSSANQGIIASAALSLGLSGGGYIANKIGKNLGIDTVSVGAPSGGGSAVAADPYAITGSQAAQGTPGAASGSQAAQLTLGKYLTPKLFVSYGVSLFQPGQTFRLRYDLGHGFKVQTESGASNGGDLIYSFERGK